MRDCPERHAPGDTAVANRPKATYAERARASCTSSKIVLSRRKVATNAGLVVVTEGRSSRLTVRHFEIDIFFSISALMVSCAF